MHRYSVILSHARWQHTTAVIQGFLYWLQICCSKHFQPGKKTLNHFKIGWKDAILVPFFGTQVKHLLKSHRWSPNLPLTWQSSSLPKDSKKSDRVIAGVSNSSRYSITGYAEFEGTHQDHQGPLLALFRASQEPHHVLESTASVLL